MKSKTTIKMQALFFHCVMSSLTVFLIFVIAVIFTG